MKVNPGKIQKLTDVVNHYLGKFLTSPREKSRLKNRWKVILDVPIEIHNLITDSFGTNDWGALADAGEMDENLEISIHARVLLTMRCVKTFNETRFCLIFSYIFQNI